LDLKAFFSFLQEPVIKNTQNQNFLEAETATIAETQVRLQKARRVFQKL